MAVAVGQGRAPLLPAPRARLALSTLPLSAISQEGSGVVLKGGFPTQLLRPEIKNIVAATATDAAITGLVSTTTATATATVVL